MRADRAFKIFRSICLHAKGKFKYSYGYYARVPRVPVYARNICEHFCNRFSNEKEFTSYVISAIIADPSLTSINELYNQEKYFNRKYDTYVKRMSRFAYYFEKDIDEIFRQLEEKNYRFSDWLYGGGVLRWYIKGKLYIDTFSILNDFTNFLEKGEQDEFFEKFYLTFCKQYVIIREISGKQKRECKRILLEKIKEKSKRT